MGACCAKPTTDEGGIEVVEPEVKGEIPERTNYLEHVTTHPPKGQEKQTEKVLDKEDLPLPPPKQPPSPVTPDTGGSTSRRL